MLLWATYIDLKYMSYPESDVVIEQVIALGRGVELNSDEFPGTVQFESPRSGDSYDRAITAASYAWLHPEVTQVVFSGGVTFVVPEHEIPEDSEGIAMCDVAEAVYPDIPAAVESWAGSTIGNFVNSVRAGMLDPNKATGIVVDERQRRNAIWAGRLVMPHAELRIISPYDNPELKATLPDEKLSNERDMRPTRKDQISHAVYRVAMLGVKPGDIEKIAARDQMVQRNILRVMRGIRKLMRTEIPDSIESYDYAS